MIANANHSRPRLPTVFSVYQPIEEYWRTCVPVHEFGSDPERVFNPLDSFLIHQILDLLGDVPILIDLAVEATGAASSVLALLHPRVETVVAAAWSKNAGSGEAFRALKKYQRGTSTIANLEIRSASDLLTDPSLPSGAVILVDVRTLAADALADAVCRWSESQPGVMILLLGFGTLGVCPALDAVLRVCPVQGSRRFWLARELEGALSASGLGVVAAEGHPQAGEVLFRIQEMYSNNYQFLDLLRAANQTTLKAANLDVDVMKAHPSAWALNVEIHEAKVKATEAREQTERMRQQAEDYHRQLHESRAKEGELRWTLEQIGSALTEARNQENQTAQQLDALQRTLAFRLAARLRRVRGWLAPESSRRFRLYQKSVRALRVWRAEGLGHVLRRVARKCLRRG